MSAINLSLMLSALAFAINGVPLGIAAQNEDGKARVALHCVSGFCVVMIAVCFVVAALPES